MINDSVYEKELSKDTVRKLAWNNVAVDAEMMIDKKTGEN